MSKKILAVVLVLSVISSLLGVFNDYEPSARARGMGGAYGSVSDDANGVFYNPAGINFAGNQVMVGHTQLFSLDYSQIINTSAVIELPKKFGSLGLGLLSNEVDYSGVNLMSEKTYKLAHSFNLMDDVHSTLTFGYSLNMYSLSFHDYGTQTTYGLTVGGRAILHERTKIGFYFDNINNPVIGEEEDHELPKTLVFGINYSPYRNIITAFDMEKKMDEATEFHAGIEMKSFDILNLRLGVRNEPVSYSGGIGIDYKGFSVDYSINTHGVLDLTHQFNLGYKL